MKRTIWDRIMKKKTVEAVKHQPCCECGKKKMRQSSLDEFFDITPKVQQKLFPLPVKAMTESIGLGSTPRRYRGMI